MATAPSVFHSLLRSIEHECCARSLSLARVEQAAGLPAGSLDELWNENRRVPDDDQWKKVSRILDALDLTGLEVVESKGPN
jgi:hypothetical protein